MPTRWTHLPRIAAAACAIGVIAANPLGAQNPDPYVLTVDMHGPDGQLLGVATFRQLPAGVMIEAQISGLAPGEHGFHIHETGACSPDFSAAGGHHAPDGSAHGFASEDGPHAGDLPNIFADTEGVASAHVLNTRVTLAGDEAPLLDEDGSALIVHARPDTYDEEAGAGGRVACGVIEQRS